MTDLSSHYLGFVLRTPLVASSSPLTGSLDGLRRLEDAGVAAVVLPSLFEEQLTGDSLAVHNALEAGAGVFAEALDYLPDLERYEVGPDSYLERITAATPASSRRRRPSSEPVSGDDEATSGVRNTKPR